MDLRIEEGVVAWSSILSVVSRHSISCSSGCLLTRTDFSSWPSHIWWPPSRRRPRRILVAPNEGFSPRAHLVRTVPCICVCRAICGENCVWIVLRGRTLYAVAFPGRLFRDPRIHCCRWPIAGAWRMAVLPPAPPPWHDLPSRYPPYQTCHRRFQLWQRSGRLDRLLQRLAEDLRDRGKIDFERSLRRRDLRLGEKRGPEIGPTWLHNCRRVVTRWERHIGNYLGMVQLACARILLRAFMR